MKFIAFFITAICIASCSLEKKSAENSVSPINVEVENFNDKIFSLCDVGNNPAKFDGKTIRLKTELAFGTENTTFSDEKCAHTAVVNFVGEDSDRAIKDVQKIYGRTPFYKVEVQVKFINKPFTQCCTHTPFQFEITKTYAAQSIKRF